jgi:hypothetical protein
MGCHLGMIHPYGCAAIPESAAEAMLLRHLDLTVL